MDGIRKGRRSEQGVRQGDNKVHIRKKRRGEEGVEGGEKRQYWILLSIIQSFSLLSLICNS